MSLPGGAPPQKRNWAPLMIGGTLVVVVAGLAFAAVSLGSGSGSDETPATVSDIITTSSTAAPEAPPEVTTDVTPTPGPLPTEVVTVVEPGQAGQYTVRPGDTLSSLARGFGVPLRALAEANGIPNWDLIHPGEVLVIPDVPD